MEQEPKYQARLVGNAVSKGSNRATRRKLWKSIPRKQRQGWADDVKRYRELQAINKPLHWEVTTTI
jgi:hypothetical protein